MLIISTSWVLFASSAVYFAYKAHCNNVVQRSAESFLKVTVELLETYRKVRESELKGVPSWLGGINRDDEKNPVIRGRKGRRAAVDYIHLDIQSKEEFIYLLHLRGHCGIHYKELTELSQLIYVELFENKEVVRISERMYKPFVGTPASEHLQTLWDTS